MREVLEDWKTGLLVPPRDSHALGESIIALLKDRTLAEDIGEAARQVAISRFSVCRMVDDYKEIYADLIRKSEDVGVQR